MKIAMTGTSGAGKTTLVKFLSEELGLKHISGSAGDIKTPIDQEDLDEAAGRRVDGHEDVIKMSATNPKFGILFQEIVRNRRHEMIRNNKAFITDRSPADNLTYFINQVGFHKEVTDGMVHKFLKACVEAWLGLDYVIYIRAVQPKESGVEDNGSRIANWYYQQSMDVQFQYWLKYLMKEAGAMGPQVILIDTWDLDERKAKLLSFFQGQQMRK